jgi:hypothetical protein
MIVNISIHRIDIRFLDWRIDTPCLSLKKEIKTHGICTPVMCIEINAQHYLIDGYQRYRIALELGISELPTVTASANIPLGELIATIQKPQIMASTIHKIQFMKCFDWPLEKASEFSLPTDSSVKLNIKRILSLSKEQLHFLHSKMFSYKEIVNLLVHPKTAFEVLINDDTHFNFSKRSFDEALSKIGALMKRHKRSLESVLKTTNYITIKQSKSTASQRLTEWMMQLTHQWSPLLIKTHKKIEDAASKVDIPAQLTYDKTLEHAGITIHSTISSSSDLEKLSAALNTPAVKDRLMAVVNLI